MTLLQAKKKALDLLSETTSSGAEYLFKINSFFDTAQKEIAQIRPIVKTATVTSADCKIPQTTKDKDGNDLNIRKITALMTTDYEVLSIVWVGNSLLVAADDDYIVEYEALPTTIDENTPDTYQFEVDEPEPVPFYGAAMCVIDENPALSSDLMARYDGMLVNLESGKRIRFVGGIDV
jgi:hypothetical protein